MITSKWVTIIIGLLSKSDQNLGNLDKLERLFYTIAVGIKLTSIKIGKFATKFKFRWQLCKRTVGLSADG